MRQPGRATACLAMAAPLPAEGFPQGVPCGLSTLPKTLGLHSGPGALNVSSLHSAPPLKRNDVLGTTPCCSYSPMHDR